MVGEIARAEHGVRTAAVEHLERPAEISAARVVGYVDVGQYPHLKDGLVRKGGVGLP